MFGSVITFFIIVLAVGLSGVKIFKEYERGVVFRLGRLVSFRGPGLSFVIPFIEKMVRVDLRTLTMNVSPQDVITRDNVSVKVTAVVYFRVVDPSSALTQVENYLFATSQLAQKCKLGKWKKTTRVMIGSRSIRSQDCKEQGENKE